MKITSSIDFKEYLKLQYVLTYKNYFVLSIAIIAIIVNLFVLKDNREDGDTTFWASFLFIYILIRPVLTYFFAKKSFKSNQILQGEIEYEFLPDKLLITSAYSKSEIPWEKLYKIKEFNDWFLIYPSNRTTYLIPKSSLTNEEIAEIKGVLLNIRGVKIKLKP